MTHASLFSGIGGFDLAAEWAGWTNLFNCEKDEFCQHILKYHFPDAIQYSDIRTTDFTIWRGRIDVLTGGFPCQPFSQAGKRQGTDDDRYLWPQMLRAIQQIQPRWIVGENVRGIVTWSQGLVFEQVCADLEAQGYQVTPYLLPACGVNAPHERYRVWFIAHRTNARTQEVREWQDGVLSDRAITDTGSIRSRVRKNKQEHLGRIGGETNNCKGGDNGIITNTSSNGLKKRYKVRASTKRASLNGFDWFPTQPPVCSRDDGLSSRLDLSAIFNGKRLSRANHREQSIKGYGNAIVPQLALRIFETINQYEQ